MKVEEVGYLGIDAQHIDAWRGFAADYIGFEVRALPDGCLGLRMDEHPWRLFLQPAQRDGVGFVGLKLADLPALETARRELVDAGIAVHDGDAADRAARGVTHLLWVRDPDGHRVEFYVDRAIDARPFAPGRPIGGFRTGTLGFGHVVMVTPQLEAMEHFYLDVLGFRMSDYFDTDIQVRFTHVNARHHSLALARGPHAFLHHVMVEYRFMDDVGRLYDKALTTPDIIRTTLGRHENDQMLSFYSRTPGGFMIETGWGGRLIDPDTWTPTELWCLSLWGHERHWDTPENRARQTEQKSLAASRGLLAPVEINDDGGFVSRAAP